MNSRERMRVAMLRGIPDRVPLMCQLAIGHYALHTEFDPIEIWFEGEAFARALVELQRRYGFDGILVNLPGRDPQWRDRVADIVPDPSRKGASRVVWRDGSYTVVPPDDLPHVYLHDGRRQFPDFDRIDPEGLFYVEPHAIEGVSLSRAEGFEPWRCDTLRRVRELAGDEVSVHGEVFSPLSQLMELLGVESGMLALVLDAGKCHAVLERLCGGAIELAELEAGAGCDAVLISSAFAGAGFLSREHYRSFELPYLQRMVREIKARHPALPLYLHTCGAIGDRLDLMEASGVDGIDTFDPPPMGTVELADAVRLLGKRLFIKGNIDPVHTLLGDTPEAVRAAALERLAAAKAGGAYILSSACSVAPHTPPENILQLRAAIEEAGIYA